MDLITYIAFCFVYQLSDVLRAAFCENSVLNLQGIFTFQGYTSQVIISNGNLKITSLKCPELCLRNVSCFSYDICNEHGLSTCQFHGRNSSITEIKEIGNCRRFVLIHTCENKFRGRCGCRHKNLVGDRCDHVYDCDGNIVPLATLASYTFTRVLSIFDGFLLSQRIKSKCDMTTDYGGWILIQRRIDGSTNFYRNWEEYENGFGKVDSNFYLGNRYISILTKEHDHELRVDMLMPDGLWRFAQYDTFYLEDSSHDYRLIVYGYTGDAGDSLFPHNGTLFSTFDHDNSNTCEVHCPNTYRGGWWYMCCHSSNLNGEYGNKNFGQGLSWFTYTTFYNSCVTTEMKIRGKR